jgi:retron-type reverse transcriptase
MFINDSYANRIGKGTSKALERFDSFKRRVFGNGRLINNARDNNMVIGYVLKADIRHYFDTVDHEILMGIIGRKVKDERTLVLIRKILNNHTATITGKGMPIGNLTSQFFANLYLNELDYFVKHGLKAKFYVRYVDDFVIMHPSIETLFTWRQQIACFLESLKLELHPEKSKIYPLHKGVNFLGYRIFYHYILLKKSNIRRMESRMREYERLYSREEITYEKVLQGFESWKSYARYANSYKVRKEFAKKLNSSFITM